MQMALPSSAQPTSVIPAVGEKHPAAVLFSRLSLKVGQGLSGMGAKSEWRLLIRRIVADFSATKGACPTQFPCQGPTVGASSVGPAVDHRSGEVWHLGVLWMSRSQSTVSNDDGVIFRPRVTRHPRKRRGPTITTTTTTTTTEETAHSYNEIRTRNC